MIERETGIERRTGDLSCISNDCSSCLTVNLPPDLGVDCVLSLSLLSGPSVALSNSLELRSYAFIPRGLALGPGGLVLELLLSEVAVERGGRGRLSNDRPGERCRVGKGNFGGGV